MNYLRSLVLMFTVLLMWGCASDFESNMGGIAGIVSDATTGDPVATVRVTLTPGGRSTVTGSDGAFGFDNLEAGKYTLDFNKEGYKPNSTNLAVRAGDPTTAHLLIERVPTIVTADRETLDFGDNQSLNTLSFNIVNSGYEDLSWEIEERCDWITEIKPSKGVLKYGKTEGIVVVIDREKLNSGENKATVIIRSSNGSSQINVTAIGQERSLPALNTLETTDITSASATFNGEIIKTGTPAYTERGFVYSLNATPTLENTIAKLTCTVNSEAKFSAKASGLEQGKTYYVRAYAKNSLGVAYSTNVVKFTTTAYFLPALNTLAATDITYTSATLNGEITSGGNPAYTERGFVYSLSATPTLENTISKLTCSVNSTSKFSANVTGLEQGKTYYFRAFAKNSQGVAYSTNVVKFTTTAYTLPALNTLAATDITYTSATLNGEITNSGNPAYTERGFVYSLNATPTLENSIGKLTCAVNATNKYSSKVIGLSSNKTYYVRAYAKNREGIAYSTNIIHFTTLADNPQVITLDILDPDISNGTATFVGEIKSVGTPAYTERGFVYSILNEPTIYDNKVVANGAGVTGRFSKTVSNLPTKTYYVRAYAINQNGVVYGEQKAIVPEWVELPEAGIAVQLKDLGKAQWETAKSMCENSTLGGYTDWRLPTKEELMVLYNNRHRIGGFITDLDGFSPYYWSSSCHSDQSWNDFYQSSYYYIDFYDGNLSYKGEESRLMVRAVRTLKK